MLVESTGKLDFKYYLHHISQQRPCCCSKLVFDNIFLILSKPVKVIFTLEHGYGNVVARHAVDVRICSCPKRDMAQEEKKHMQTTKEVKKVNK